MAYNATYETNDFAPAIIDLLVGIVVGMATFALVIGLGIGLGWVARHFKFLRMVQ